VPLRGDGCSAAVVLPSQVFVALQAIRPKSYVYWPKVQWYAPYHGGILCCHGDGGGGLRGRAARCSPNLDGRRRWYALHVKSNARRTL
jgi:hypothetical protein